MAELIADNNVVAWFQGRMEFGPWALGNRSLLAYPRNKDIRNLTGVPILLSTSFNDSEPEVCSPENAIKTFLKTRIDYLVLGDYITRSCY
ncbi:carbamoyltransferase C-terminal domain-containing protein [Acerihabitans sp. KWT182]|uniref:Carbamoyltransferase C-terminal domain-containing protein n=1 Tax=Acerihabitans sp. KWT182 TaxID=3157919 RepID=A0AAU7Q673_9GAMM